MFAHTVFMCSCALLIQHDDSVSNSITSTLVLWLCKAGRATGKKRKKYASSPNPNPSRHFIVTDQQQAPYPSLLPFMKTMPAVTKDTGDILLLVAVEVFSPSRRCLSVADSSMIVQCTTSTP